MEIEAVMTRHPAVQAAAACAWHLPAHRGTLLLPLRCGCLTSLSVETSTLQAYLKVGAYVCFKQATAYRLKALQGRHLLAPI